MTAPDPARATLVRALADIDARVAMQTNAIVRAVCGGVGWFGEVTRRHRAGLASALMDRSVAARALKCLDEIDAETGKP